jgi:hypothetical protein
MAYQYPGAKDNITVASLSSPYISADGGGTVSATNINAGTFTAGTFNVTTTTFNHLTANTLTANAVSTITLSGLTDLGANNITANNIITSTLSGLSTLSANTINVNNLSNLSSLTANTVTAFSNITIGNQILSGPVSGLAVSPAPFLPITQSGIKDIIVQGEGIAFNGKSFSNMAGTPNAIGTYSYLFANVDAYVNRNDRQAGNIPDLDIAYCDDPTGNVLYSYDLVILYPTNPANYSGFMAVEGANRGQATMCYLEDVNDVNLYANGVPSLAANGTSTPGTGSGNAFRYQQGDMIVYVGWECGRPQSLSNVCVDYFSNNANANVNAQYNWPGQGMSSNLALSPATSVGLGVTLPFCYSDSSFNEVISGLCTDYGYFPYSDTGAPATGSPNNTFVMYYPILPNTEFIMSIGYNYEGAIGTTIPLDASLYDLGLGYGNAGRVSSPYAGFSTIVEPVEYNPSYITVDRASVMMGTNGQPMNVAYPEFYNAYASVLEPDSSGYLRDYGCEYSMSYTGFNTSPALLGQLGIRDIVSYLRYGVGNLFANDTNNFWGDYSGLTSNTMMWGYAQSGELVRSFLYNGFNVDSKLRPVFDCCFVSQTGANRRQGDSYRFSKPNDMNLKHFGPQSRASNFPYSYETMEDPFTGNTDGILYKYKYHSTCTPLVYHVASSHDFFALKESLLVTDTLGKALNSVRNNVQYFYVTGAPYKMTFSYTNTDLAAPIDSPTEGAAQGDSPVAQTFMYRACYWYLKQWAASGSPTSPLTGVHPVNGPIVADSTSGVPNATVYYAYLDSLISVGAASGYWPDLSTIAVKNNVGDVVNSNALVWNMHQYLQPSYVTETGDVNIQYPVYGPPLQYAVFLPLTDSSGTGNDIGGVGTPETKAALLTVRGYNTYVRGYNMDDMVCLSSGAIPLSSNASMLFTNDPRPTINALYGNCTTWENTWTDAVDNLVTNGYMLPNAVFSYDNVCYTNRGTYQASLLNSVHGLPVV